MYKFEFLYLIPEFFFCFFLLTLFIIEYLYTDKKITYLNLLKVSCVVFFIQTINYIIIYNYYFLNNKNSNIDNITIIIKIIITITMFLLLIMKLRNAVFKDNTFNLIFKRYLIILNLSYISLMFFIMSNNFITFVITLEIIGLASAILISEPEINNKEKIKFNINASFTYYIIHVIGSITLLFSITCFYYLTGSLNFNEIYIIINNNYYNNYYLLNIGFTGLFLSLFIKTGIAPFHTWILRAYKDLNMFNLMYFLIVIKTCIIFVIYKIIIIFNCFYNLNNNFFLIIALLNLVIGPIITITQTSIKKFLIGSSITNVGYIFISIIYKFQIFNGFYLLLFLITYTSAMLSFFFIIQIFQISNTLQELMNLPNNLKLISIFSIINLMGFPPTIGFFIKIKILSFIFYNYPSFTIIALLFSIIAMGYYF